MYAILNPFEFSFTADHIKKAAVPAISVTRISITILANLNLPFIT